MLFDQGMAKMVCVLLCSSLDTIYFQWLYVEIYCTYGNTHKKYNVPGVWLSSLFACLREPSGLLHLLLIILGLFVLTVYCNMSWFMEMKAWDIFPHLWYWRIYKFILLLLVMLLIFIWFLFCRSFWCFFFIFNSFLL